MALIKNEQEFVNNYLTDPEFRKQVERLIGEARKKLSDHEDAAMKLGCNMDILRMGGQITADGKYII
jgi:hypothetical protein